jgi:hypothetical protein
VTKQCAAKAAGLLPLGNWFARRAPVGFRVGQFPAERKLPCSQQLWQEEILADFKHDDGIVFYLTEAFAQSTHAI